MSIIGSETVDQDASRDPTPGELDRAELLTPIEQRLPAALARFPLAIQRQGLPIDTIRAQLRGKRRGSYAPYGALARALAKIGWQKRQHWEKRATGEVITLWYPPGVCPVSASIAARLKLPVGRPPKWLQRARQLAKESGYIL